MTAEIPGLGVIELGKTQIRHRPTEATGPVLRYSFGEPENGLPGMLVLQSPTFGMDVDDGPLTKDVLVEDCEVVS